LLPLPMMRRTRCPRSKAMSPILTPQASLTRSPSGFECSNDCRSPDRQSLDGSAEPSRVSFPRHLGLVW
jgi:hypothetical protein